MAKAKRKFMADPPMTAEVLAAIEAANQPPENPPALVHIPGVGMVLGAGEKGGFCVLQLGVIRVNGVERQYDLVNGIHT